MKNLLLSVLLFLGVRSSHKPNPEVFIKLGQADQICASNKMFTPVDIFVTTSDIPESTAIDYIINGKYLTTLYGNNTHVRLEKAGLGQHEIRVEAGEYYAEKSFTVYNCD